MRTISKISEVTIELDSEKDLLEGKWIPFEHLSELLAEKEKSEGTINKYYRQMLYNAIKAGRINYEIKAGIKCIDTESPMLGPAAIKLIFVSKL